MQKPKTKIQAKPESTIVIKQPMVRNFSTGGGHLPGDGLLPTLIQWSDARHPTDAMPDERIELTALAATHPAPAPIRATLAKLGLSETLKVSYDARPRLAAMFSTPRGPVTL